MEPGSPTVRLESHVPRHQGFAPRLPRLSRRKPSSQSLRTKKHVPGSWEFAEPVASPKFPLTCERTRPQREIALAVLWKNRVGVATFHFESPAKYELQDTPWGLSNVLLSPICFLGYLGLPFLFGQGLKPRTPREHPNPTTKIGPKMGGAPKTPKWDPIGFEPWPFDRQAKLPRMVAINLRAVRIDS